MYVGSDHPTREVLTFGSAEDLTHRQPVSTWRMQRLDRQNPMALRFTNLTAEEARFARRELYRRKLTALFFVLPLLVFVAFAFVAPIATMLYRSVYHPTVANLIPNTLGGLKDWTADVRPSDDVLKTMAADLKRLGKERRAGKLAEEINRVVPGTSSMIKSTTRKLRRAKDAELTERGHELLLAAHKKWNDTATWRAIRTAGQVYTPNYYLTALDLERSPDGNIQARKSAKIYVKLYTKTLRIALIITLLTFLLGYPLSYYLANAPSKTANMLMVLVLLPFWTSLLVRTTSWIALLQTNGVVNSFLMGIGVTDEPLEMLYTHSPPSSP